MSLQATTSQTVGPFFKIGLSWLYRDTLVSEGVAGQRVTIQGRIFDGDGVPVPDAILEVWQANAQGKYNHPEDTQDKPLEPGFTGFARVAVNAEGAFRFTTIKPGPVLGPDGKEQAPHLLVSIFMRGMLRRMVTRIYFPDEPRNSADFILNLVEAARRSTLIAKKTAQKNTKETDSTTLEWNVILQGPEETVFFDLGL
jgi:protocatechuate 3,4-dioxygenase, alpha subunit